MIFFVPFLVKVLVNCNFEDNETSDRVLNPALGSLDVHVFLFRSFSGKGRQARGERGALGSCDGWKPPKNYRCHAGYLRSAKKKPWLYLSVNVMSTKLINYLEVGPPIYVVVRTTQRSGHCKAKALPRAISHFSLRVSFRYRSVPGIEPATSRSAVEFSVDWAIVLPLI